MQKSLRTNVSSSAAALTIKDQRKSKNSSTNPYKNETMPSIPIREETPDLVKVATPNLDNIEMAIA